MPAKPVAIIMGSQSDWATMKHAADTLDALKIAYEARIVSAHRTPKRLYDFATTARDQGFKVIIAGAGGAAHLPGMAASMTPLPVLGVPMNTHALEGKDSLLSILQMPGGIPVGTLAMRAPDQIRRQAAEGLTMDMGLSVRPRTRVQPSAGPSTGSSGDPGRTISNAAASSLDSRLRGNERSVCC